MNTRRNTIIISLMLTLALVLSGQALAGNGKGRGPGSGTGDCIHPDGPIGPGGTGRNGEPGEFPRAGRGFGPGRGEGPVIDLFAGDSVTVTGAVAEIGYFGRGVTIDTGEEMITIYGLGPIRYWEGLDVARPDVGETITVNGYNVTFSSGESRIIAASVIVGDTEVALRDSESGAPLWRGPGRFGAPVTMPEEDDDDAEE